MDHTVHLADLLDVLFDGALPLDVYADANSLLFDALAVESAGLSTGRDAVGRAARAPETRGLPGAGSRAPRIPRRGRRRAGSWRRRRRRAGARRRTARRAGRPGARCGP